MIKRCDLHSTCKFIHWLFLFRVQCSERTFDSKLTWKGFIKDGVQNNQIVVVVVVGGGGGVLNNLRCIFDFRSVYRASRHER